MTANEKTYRVVKCLLGQVDFRSNVNGTAFAARVVETNNKQYSFLADTELDVNVGDIVICQVRSSLTFGYVASIDDELVTHEQYLMNAVLEEGAHKLVLGVVDWRAIETAVRAKAIYRKRERELAALNRVNTAAFDYMKENLE